MAAILDVGTVLCGFCVNSVTDVPDVRGRLWRMTYEKNGAELAWLERNDDVKSFAIAFKTLPDDDTGVAHILEHSVLCGSDKFPVKSPFDELRKSSLRVFMNAMTSRDKTYYPFSSRNDKDFINLADVYLDAVFHPKAMSCPLAFRQEGWHFEMDEDSGALSYNGVVYNEMKGVFADPEHAASRTVLRYLYPETVYGKDSGGRPEAIPNLTYDQFCTFYRRHYHPSNSRIFLDGQVDIKAMLTKLDSYLKDFGKVNEVSRIGFQKAVASTHRMKYPSTVCERRTILADAWSVGTFDERLKKAVLDALVEYLAGSNEAPLKKALLSQGLCEDLEMYWYDFQQLPLFIVVRNTSDEQAEKCRKLVRKTLEQIVAEGFDRARLRAIINKNEFNEREVNSSRPRGLVYFSRAISQWLYGGDPASAFDISGIYKELRERVNSGLFERCVKDMLLNNSHHAELTYSPDAEIKEEINAQEAATLAKIRSCMTKQDVEALHDEIGELKKYQSREDSPKARKTIPALRVRDIPKTGRIVDYHIETTSQGTSVKTEPTCDGVAYLAVYFPIDGMDEEALVSVPLFARLLGKLRTARHDALALQTEIADKIGRITFSAVAAERRNYLCAKVAVLTEKDVDAVGLFREILFETQFDDVTAIEKELKQAAIDCERHVAMRGDHLAECYAAKGLSRRWASREILHGYTQLRWLQGAKVDDALLKRYWSFLGRVFVRNGVVLSMTTNVSASAESALKGMLEYRDGSPMLQESKISLNSPMLAGLRLDGDTGYSSTVATLPPDCPYNGSMRVAAKVLSLDYLHREVREIGGAYGTAMNILPSGLISSYSYRDPTPSSSIDKIRGCGEALQRFVASDADVDRYILSTIAGVDVYRPPEAEAYRPAELFINMRSFIAEEEERKQILSTNRDALRGVALMLQNEMKDAHSFVVGGSRQTAGIPNGKIETLQRR